MNIRRQSRKIQFEEDYLSKCAQGISKLYNKVLLLMQFSKTKPQVKNMNIIYHDLFYTGIKIRDDNQFVNEKNENKENDYTKDDDFNTPNHYT